MRYFRLGAAVLAAMFIGAASAHAQVLLYSFEAGDSPNSLDGFSNLAGDSLSNSTTVGVTNGAQSLFVTNPSPSFAGIATNSNVGLIQNDKVTSISMDATIPSGEAYTGGYYLLGITLYDEVAGNPYTGDSWQVAGSDEQSIYQATGNGVPQHITIPLTGSDPNTFAATTYGQLVDNGWVTTGFEIFQDHNAALNFAIDNVRANEVPEPATLGIGAVSSLLLLARRRKATSR